MSFIIQEPASQPEPAVRTDPAKYTKLKQKVTTLLGTIPEGTTLDMIDIFDLTVAVRGALPSGLAAADFDGNDVTQIVTELLGV